jgi:hypothetical protein
MDESRVKLTKHDGELLGTVSISRPSCSSGEEYISLEFIDELSRTRFLDVRMSLDAFSRAITGQGYAPCYFVSRPAKIGMRSEHKTERVPYISGAWTNEGKEAMIANMAKFECDGWKGSESDLFNHHRHVRTNDGEFQEVTFFRHVPA